MKLIKLMIILVSDIKSNVISVVNVYIKELLHTFYQYFLEGCFSESKSEY